MKFISRVFVLYIKSSFSADKRRETKTQFYEEKITKHTSMNTILIVEIEANVFYSKPR